MGRPKGKLSRDHDEKRRDLLRRLQTILLDSVGRPPSLRELARSVGVSVPTLQHYFGSREQIVVAAIKDFSSDDEEISKRLRTPAGNFSASIQEMLDYVVEGFTYGRIAELMGLGMVEGMASSASAASFLSSFFEPTLEDYQARLQAHVDSGEMVKCDLRIAALELVAPVMLAFLHQSQLGGADSHPLDIGHLVSQHASAFCRAYGVSAT